MNFFGTTFLGTVQRLGRESVQTRFLILGLPVAPLRSYYIADVTSDGHAGLPIPLSLPSVAAAYLRFYLPLLALLLALLALWHRSLALALLAVLALLAFLPARFLLGRLSRTDRSRRQLLQKLTGLSAEPAWIPPDQAALIVDRLRPVLQTLRLPLDTTYWTDRAPDPSHAPFLFAYASYAQRTDPARNWSTIAETAFRRIPESARSAAASHAPRAKVS